MQRDYQTIIIGAGASGLMLAALLQDKANILLIDTNPKIGAKIAISGGGKCNLTNENVSANNYLGIDWFVQSVLDRFTQEEVIAWFADRGLTLETRKDGQYFCQRSADEVIEIFRRELKGVALALDTKVTAVSQNQDGFIIETEKSTFSAKELVVATGGLSFARIGASGIGFDIAKNFGHKISDLSPALVGFTVQKEQFFFKELSGSSVPVVLHTEAKSFRGDLLFAHKGISGPVVLNASLYWKKGALTIDFLPEFFWEAIQGSKKSLSTLFPLPKKVAKALLAAIGMEDKTAQKVSQEEWRKLKQLNAYRFSPAGTFGYTKAEATRGGVVTSEIDPYTMMSLNVPHLYFVGEVLDVTGELGGYNFQWAFSSAYCCAEAIKEQTDV